MSRHEEQTSVTVELPDPLAPAAVPTRGPQASATTHAPARHISRLHQTWQQIVSGLILTACLVTAAAWYVPRVLSANRRLLTGSVVASGIATLDFTSAGEIARIAVHQGERVRKGEVLATEYAPDLAAVLSADVAVVRSEKSKLAVMSSAASRPAAKPSYQVVPTSADLAAVRAQLKLDEAQLTTDQVHDAASRIIAPASGTIAAANGRPGETVTTQGIRDYATDAPQTRVDQAPRFSLLPEGPQTDQRASGSSATLPVIALRTSSTWQVTALVPEDTVSRIKTGEQVSVSVPAARIRAIPGRLSELLADPVATSQGDEYQAVVTVAGHVAESPLSGMAADVRLDTPARRPAP